MEQLQYVIEDSTIAYLLGINNFTNDESAVLELVKNAYDAQALNVKILFSDTQLTIIDDGTGMNEYDIRSSWMHVGKSSKEYDIYDSKKTQRVLAGSKGVGRFALARLGASATVKSKKANYNAVIWKTDWNTSTLETISDLDEIGTTIIISSLREKWGKRKVANLVDFLSKTYNDDVMRISIEHPDFCGDISAFFQRPIIGVNCLTTIGMKYCSIRHELYTIIDSDEFLEAAQKYCSDIDLNHKEITIDIFSELKNSSDYELTEAELYEHLSQLGSFSGSFSFYIKPSAVDCEKFLYKYRGVPQPITGGVVLYRNAFSISSYEGKKDWLGFGKRSRKSPAAASHPTGSWRVRENQISGKVEIDRKENAVLEDLSNRQGLEENTFYHLFVDIILLGFKEFERYRQEIVRAIDKKNTETGEELPTPISDKVISNPRVVQNMSDQEAHLLAQEIKKFKLDQNTAKRERETVEERYKYDVRILNVLSTIGLKASSIAHEIKNDRNAISKNTEYIISALQEYGMWEELQSPDLTTKAYKNVPALLNQNRDKSQKILSFMNAMLTEIEKKQFQSSMQDIYSLLTKIKENWEQDYAWITISLISKENLEFVLPEDVLHVIFDNLILNSIQQNESKNHLEIKIQALLNGSVLQFVYSDNGKGLDKKYKGNPLKILEVHETTRKNGHGLGMWIVNNTILMSGGEVINLSGDKGFSFEFTIGDVL